MPTESRTDVAARLIHCTVIVRVDGRRRGTGFFVAPMTVVTCWHVLSDRRVGTVDVRWADQDFVATVIPDEELQARDLVLLRITSKSPLAHPTVSLTRSWSIAAEVYGYGYSDARPEGESVLATIEGPARLQGRRVIKLKAAQILHGLSGSPLIHLDHGAVLGVLSVSRGTQSDLGGFAIPVELLADRFGSVEPRPAGFDDSVEALRVRMQARVDDTIAAWLDGFAPLPLRFVPYAGVTLPQARAFGGVAPQALRSASVTEVFENLGGALLIVGESGAGKTMSLTQIADRLLEQPDAPVPVLVNLASWKPSQSIAAWVGEEILRVYRIRVTSVEKLVVLFDGFEDLPFGDRSACSDALSVFFGDGRPSAVCSRKTAYEEAGSRLKADGAIELLPVTREALRAYIEEEAEDPQRVNAALDADPLLFELAKIPLMLHIVLQTNVGPIADPAATLEERRAQLFDLLIAKLYAKHGDETLFRRADMDRSLASLARFTPAKSAFRIESLQPTALPPGRQRWEYLLSTRALFWFCAVLPTTWLAFVAWLAVVPFSTLVDGLLMRVPGTRSRIRNLGFGLLLAVTASLLMYWIGRITRTELTHWDRWSAVAGWLVVFHMQTRKRGFGAEILTFERLRWNPAIAFKRALKPVGVIAGITLLLQILLEPFIKGPPSIPIYFENVVKLSVPAFLLLFPFMGWSRVPRPAKTRPNEGMALTLMNALIVGGGISAAVLVILVLSLAVQGHSFAERPWQLFLGFLPVPFLLAGGNDILRHYVLRLMLHSSRILPLRLSKFLEYGTRLRLLVRTSGSYQFWHAQLREHLAAKH
jgi:hypothetical protein